MAHTRNSGAQLWAIFTVLIVAVVAVTVTSLLAVMSIRDARRDALFHAARTVAIARLARDAERMTAAKRGYFLDRDDESLRRMHDAAESFTEDVAAVRTRFQSADSAPAFADVAETGHAYISALRGLTVGSTADGSDAAGVRRATQTLYHDVLDALRTLEELEKQHAAVAERLAGGRMRRALAGVTLAATVAFTVAIVLALMLVRALRALGAKQRETDAYLRELHAVNQDLDAFAGRIAHDLRNALAPAMMSIATLRHEPNADAREHIVDRIDRTTRKSLRLLDGLLAFSRSGAASAADSRASVRRALADVVDEVAELARETDAMIECRAEDLDVACSPELLHLLLANLVNNAVKFLRGRPERRVAISVTADRDGMCRIVVEDTGPGVPADARQRIFEPFYRVPGVTVTGVGIGLATVRRIADAHGGRVTVGSTGATGAAFTVWLPLAMEVRPADGASAESAGAHVTM